MNDRDRALGRLLLQRNLCTREVLQQAGQTTLARRQAGQQVEILVVLVEMGVLETAVARQLWSEVAGGAAVTPAAAPPPRPAHVEEGSGEFSPVSTLSTMGEAPPAVPPGYSPLAASTRPGTGSFVRPATGSFARPATGSFAGSASGSYAGPASGSYAGPAPTANGAFFVDDAPTLGGAPPPGAFSASDPTLRGNLLDALAPGASPFDAPPGDRFDFGPPPPMPASGPGGFDFGAPPPMPASGPGGFDFGAPPPMPASAPGGFDFGAPAPMPASAPGGFDFGAPASAPGGFDFGAPAAAPASAPGGFDFGPPPAAAPPAIDFAAPASQGGYGFGPPPAMSAVPTNGHAPAAPAPTAPVEPGKGSQRGKKGGSGRSPGTPSARLSKTRAGGAPPRGSGPPVALIGGLAALGLVVVVGAVLVSRGGEKDGATVAATPPGQQPSPARPSPTDPEADPGRPRPPGPREPRKLVAPTAPPSTQAETDAQSETWAEQLLIEAWELQDRERYEDAVKVLEGFPAALRGGKGYHDVKEKLAEYSRFAGYKRKLEGAIAAGGGSEELRSLVGRVESGRMERDLLKLPCTDRFKDDARRVLGSSVYDELAMKAIDLPPEVTVPDDEE